jgi:uncharacterized protein (TIGR00251 family)
MKKTQKTPEKTKQTLIIKIKVEPRSSRAGNLVPHGEGWKIKLSSPPVKGKANRELIEVLSKTLNLRKTDIEIIGGKTSKNKLVRLYGIESIIDRLKINKKE